MTSGDGTADPRAAAEAAAKAAAEAEQVAEEARRKADELAAAAQAAATGAPAAPAPAVATPKPTAPSEWVATVEAGYAFEGAALTIGALVDADVPVPSAQVRIPLAMLNRHGLVAGATGTGKTKTLQVLAEQVAAHGVPVFAADIKGDLSGIATPGEPGDKLAARCESIGQQWTPTATPTEYFTLGGVGTGVPLRASVTSFGPVLLAKVLGLNETQESSLGLVFHYARNADLPLVTLADLRAVLQHLTGAEGKAELKDLGGLSAQTAGVILRELIGFSDQGADVFFGRPEVSTSDFLRTSGDSGVVSLLEVPGVQDRPALFSTFLMYLLQQLFRELPEVGDADEPKLVFFFDEAHLLFRDASKSFLESITQTVRLIRSKGVGIFFVTQTPKDVPSDVLGQLGSRVQHQLRAHTPDDARALKATVSTYPTSAYDLGEVLTQLAIGEAIVTVMNEKGAPSPVAWTRVRAPQGSMEPTPADAMQATVSASPLLAKYGTPSDEQGAAAVLASRTAAAPAAPASGAKAGPEPGSPAWEKQEAERIAKEAKKLEKARPKASSSRSRRMSPLDRAAGEAGRTLARELIKNLFKRR